MFQGIGQQMTYIYRKILEGNAYIEWLYNEHKSCPVKMLYSLRISLTVSQIPAHLRAPPPLPTLKVAYV